MTSEETETMVKVFSNPYGAVTEVPQATFKKAHGFFLVYDATKPESVSCLGEYLEGIREHKSEDMPVVLLGLDPENHLFQDEATLAATYANQQAVDDLLRLYEIDHDAHFKLARSEKNAEESFAALAKASLARVEPNALWDYDHVNDVTHTIPKP